MIRWSVLCEVADLHTDRRPKQTELELLSKIIKRGRIAISREHKGAPGVVLKHEILCVFELQGSFKRCSCDSWKEECQGDASQNEDDAEPFFVFALQLLILLSEHSVFIIDQARRVMGLSKLVFIILDVVNTRLESFLLLIHCLDYKNMSKK